MSEKMSQIALGIEKYRLNSEHDQFNKLFVIGTSLEDELIEDLDNMGLPRVDSQESDEIGKDFDKVERLPFMKNVFPALKAGAIANEKITKNWKNFYTELKSQLSKVQGLRETLQRRSVAISSFKTNSALIVKKKLKESTVYNYEQLNEEITALEEENKQLEDKIMNINKVLGQDLDEFTLSENIKNILTEFLAEHKKNVAIGMKEVNKMSAKINS